MQTINKTFSDFYTAWLNNKPSRETTKLYLVRDNNNIPIYGAVLADFKFSVITSENLHLEVLETDTLFVDTA